MTKQSKTSSNDKITCKWCGKSFVNERTISVHMCVKKRRWVDKDLTHVRLGFRAFQMFYQMQINQTQPKTMENFIQSQFYSDFTKFGRSCIKNQYLKPEKFIEWLIKNNKKLSMWGKDKTYDEFFLQYIKEEPAMKAFERTVSHFAKWSEEHQIPWNEYFIKAAPARVVYDIRSGKVSPWVIYLSETGTNCIIKRLSDEQKVIVNQIVDGNFWLNVFRRNKNKKEVDMIVDICKTAGI